MDTKNRANVAIIVGAVLTVIGIAAGVYKWVAGEQITGLSSMVIWGLEAAGIYTAAACGAGLMALAGVKDLTERITVESRKRMLSGALAALLIAGALVMIDLSRPVNIFDLFAAFAIDSYMTWDFYLLMACTIITIVYLVVSGKENVSKGLAILSIVAAVVVVVIEAMMTTSILGREVWANGLNIVEFLIACAVIGSAAVFTTCDDTAAAQATGAAAAILLVCMLSELLASNDSALLLSSPYLWIGLVCLVGVAVCGFTGKASVLSFILAAVGVLCEKVWVLAYGQATHLFSADTAYVAEPVEWAIVLGMFGFGVLLYELIFKASRGKSAKA